MMTQEQYQKTLDSSIECGYTTNTINYALRFFVRYSHKYNFTIATHHIHYELNSLKQIRYNELIMKPKNPLTNMIETHMDVYKNFLLCCLSTNKLPENHDTILNHKREWKNKWSILISNI
jgi:hypothetical protein